MRALNELPRTVAAGMHTVFTDIDDTLTTDGQLTCHRPTRRWTPCAAPACASSSSRGAQRGGATTSPACGRLTRSSAKTAPSTTGTIRSNASSSAAICWTRWPARPIPSGSRPCATPSCARCLAVPWRLTSSAACTTWPSISVKTSPPLRMRDVDRIVALMEAAGMTAKVSSIHVNGWFGQYDKLSMAHLLHARALRPGAVAGARKAACSSGIRRMTPRCSPTCRMRSASPMWRRLQAGCFICPPTSRRRAAAPDLPRWRKPC